MVIAGSLLLLPKSADATMTSTPYPVFEPLDHTYNLIIGHKSYPIRYGFSEGYPIRNDTSRGLGGAVVKSMSADYASKSIEVVIDDNLTSADKRYFIIELPRNIINANTTEMAAGCSSVIEPLSGKPPEWVQEHDLDYTVIVSIKTPQGEIAGYNGNVFNQCGRDTRVLSIEYLGGGSTIIIQGTAMIPEFSSSVALVVATAAIVGVIVVGKRTFQQKLSKY